MKDNYQQQAADFLAKYGISFSFKLANTKRPSWDNGRQCNHFVVTLKKGRRRVSFDFFDSTANFESGIEELDAYSVLSCCSGEFYCPETYSDYLSDFGAEDCKEQKKTYNAWKRQSAKLQKFFDNEETREDLLEIR